MTSGIVSSKRCSQAVPYLRIGLTKLAGEKKKKIQNQPEQGQSLYTPDTSTATTAAVHMVPQQC